MTTLSTAGKATETFYQPLSKSKAEGPWDVIVIGSGIGGMGCAAALSKYGKRVLLLEQHYVPGGFTHMFSRKDYKWDVGIHCVGEMGEGDVPAKLMSWLSDGDCKWNSMGEIYDRFFFPDFEIEFSSNWERFKTEVKRKFPDDAASVDRYSAAIRAAVAEVKPFFAFRALPGWMGKTGNRLMRVGRKSDPWSRTTREVMEELVPNPRLRSVLTAQWGYYGATPQESSFAIHAMTVAHFATGGYYPVGGSQRIAETFLRGIRRSGGETLTRAAVQEIIVRKGRAVGVRMADGREFFAPKIVSAAGAHVTVEQLIPTEQRETSWARGISRLEQSPPHLCLYLGIEGDIQAAGGTPANQWYFKSWDMDDRDWQVEDPRATAPLLYMSFPTLKDPDHDPGPTQRHTAEVVTFVPWRSFAQWKDTRRGNREKEYMEFKKGIQDRMIAQLRTHVPKIMDLVKYAELSTPLSTQFFTHAVQGSIYGLAPNTERFGSPHLKIRTPIRGLYMAGGDVTTLGVTSSLVSGVLAAGVIQPRVFKKFF